MLILALTLSQERQALLQELALRSGVAERLAAEVAAHRERSDEAAQWRRERDEAVERCRLLKLELEQHMP